MATNDSTPRTIEIPLTKGYVAIVDEQDADLALQKWQAFIARDGKQIYAKCATTGRFMHREILARILQTPLERYELTDHKNHIGTDNRRENLRLATHANNMHNTHMKVTNSAGYKGVSSRTDNTFRAGIRIDGKATHIGTYRTALEAACAYNKAAIENFGEFACINEIPNWEQVIIAPLGRDNKGKSGFKGVTFYKAGNKFRAFAYVGKKQIHLGYFDTPELANEAHLKFLAEMDT